MCDTVVFSIHSLSRMHRRLQVPDIACKNPGMTFSINAKDDSPSKGRTLSPGHMEVDFG